MQKGDVIYRQQAIDEVINLWADKPFGNPTLVEIKGCIEALPSVQPEIIKCKDCKYMTEHYDTDGNVPYWTCSEWDSGTDYDGFCHYAERRTDE